jgi:hypothetical protein
MKKSFTISIMTILLLGLNGVIASCSYERNVTYNVEEDTETGVLLNQDWRNFYDPENAYYNNTNGLVNVRSGPSNKHKVIGYLKPQEGGFIQSCNFDLSFCYMKFGAAPEPGWVNMTYMKEGTVEYTR